MNKLPIIHATLPETEWEKLTLQNGWEPVPGHTPMYKWWGPFVLITGAVLRKNGAYLNHIATIPDKNAAPTSTQLIGASVTNSGAFAEIYVEQDGNISINGYNTLGDTLGMSVPLSCMYIPKTE